MVEIDPVEAVPLAEVLAALRGIIPPQVSTRPV
jgi:hypothetical protein